MPAPTFVGAYATAFNSGTSPKSSASFDVAVGDVMASIMADAGFETGDDYTWGNSGTGMTWTEQTRATASSGNDVFIQAAHATPAGAQTGITGSLTRVTGTATHFFGGVFARFANATMTGVTAGARSTTPDTSSPYQLAITTTLANSAILYGLADYNALDHSARVHTTVNGYTPSSGNGLELSYFRDSATYTFCTAYIPDAGAAGAKTVGMTGAAAGDFLLVAVEIGGTTPAGKSFPIQRGRPTRGLIVR